MGVTPGAGLKGGTRYEQLTPLGKHLSALPVDVRIGTPATHPPTPGLPRTQDPLLPLPLTPPLSYL